jgi:hypothetical protein
VGHVTFQLLRAKVEAKVLVSHCRGRKAEWELEKCLVYETYKEGISNSSVRLKGNRSFPTKLLAWSPSE